MSLSVISGEDLRRLRVSHGLTQKEVAKKAGVSQSLVARIEAGKVDPRLSTLKKILNSIMSIKVKKTAMSVMHSPVVSVRVKDSVKKAVDLMEKHGISQLPVVDDGMIVGSVQEGTIIRKLLQSKDPEKIFRLKVGEVMEEPFTMVAPSTSIDEVLTLFTHEKPAVLVVDKGKLVGIITKIDVITSIRSE